MQEQQEQQAYPCSVQVQRADGEWVEQARCARRSQAMVVGVALWRYMQCSVRVLDGEQERMYWPGSGLPGLEP